MRADTRQALANRIARHENYEVFVGGFLDTIAQGKGAPPSIDRLKPGQCLKVNEFLISPKGSYRLVLQSDGNLVLYAGMTVLWATDTNGKPVTQAVMQTDGNFVLYGADHRSYWASKTDGHPGAFIVLQEDNNLVIYESQNQPVFGGGLVLTGWHYVDNPLWSSRLAQQAKEHHGPFDDIAQFISTAAAACGKEIGKGVQTIAGGLHDIQKAISKIPGIGGALATLYDLGTAPFTTAVYTAEAVSKGENIGQALKDQLDRIGKELDDVLPWIASIISIFPVFGPLVSSIIMTAAALLEGQPIEEVLIEAALSLIPGMAVFAHFAGPIIEFGIRLAMALAKGVLDLSAIVVDGLKAICEIIGATIPDFIYEAIACGVHFCAYLARGMKVVDALAQEGVELLKKYGPQLLGSAYNALHIDTILKTIGDAASSEAEKLAAHLDIAKALTDIKLPGIPGPLNDLIRKAFGGSMSLGCAAHIQAGMKGKVLAVVGDLAQKGGNLAQQEAAKAVAAAQTAVKNAVSQLTPAQFAAQAKDLCLSEARKLVPPQCLNGFDIAIGLAQNQTNCFQMLTIRSSLDGPGAQGFDMGASFHIGRVAFQPPPLNSIFAGGKTGGMVSFGPSLAQLASAGVGSHPVNVVLPPGFQFPRIVPKVTGAPLPPSVAAGASAGYFMTGGMMPLPPGAKTTIMGPIADDPVSRVGAISAVAGIAAARDANPSSASVTKVSWWHRFLMKIGFFHTQTATSVHAT